MSKAPEAFRTISEAADQLDLPQHVLRHWEDVFGQIRPMRRAGGRRYYRTYDLELLNGVRALLYDERYTTKGVQKIFKDNGAQFVAEIGRKAFAGEPLDLGLRNSTDADENSIDTTVSDQVPVGTDVRELDQSEVSKLRELLISLENAQDSLEDAILAIDTIAALDEDSR